MKSYEIVKGPTSDVLFYAYGKEYEELFVNAAKGLFSVICDIEKIENREEEEFFIEENTTEELMISWLQELIASVDVANNFYSHFTVKISKDKGRIMLKATAFGEPISLNKTGTLVKAVTYHEFEIKKVDELYRVKVVVDI